MSYLLQRPLNIKINYVNKHIHWIKNQASIKWIFRLFIIRYNSLPNEPRHLQKHSYKLSDSDSRVKYMVGQNGPLSRSIVICNQLGQIVKSNQYLINSKWIFILVLCVSIKYESTKQPDFILNEAFQKTHSKCDNMAFVQTDRINVYWPHLWEHDVPKRFHT